MQKKRHKKYNTDISPTLVPYSPGRCGELHRQLGRLQRRTASAQRDVPVHGDAVDGHAIDGGAVGLRQGHDVGGGGGEVRHGGAQVGVGGEVELGAEVRAGPGARGSVEGAFPPPRASHRGGGGQGMVGVLTGSCRPLTGVASGANVSMPHD